MTQKISDEEISQWLHERFDQYAMKSWSDEEYSYYYTCARNSLEKLRQLKQEWNHNNSPAFPYYISLNAIKGLDKNIQALNEFLGSGEYEEELEIEKKNAKQEYVWLRNQQL